MPAAQLDDRERELLTAYRDEDPDEEYYIAPWALSTTMGFDTAVAVARQLCQRKLLEGDAGARGRRRGYFITDKGRAAL